MTDTSSLITTEYTGNYVYENSVLQFFNHAEGYVEPVSAGSTTFVYVYQYKDHLGNVRLSYADSNGDGIITATGTGAEIREENNYYPFGLKHKGYNNAQTGKDHKYGYNGKEEQDELNLAWLDFGARNYDAALGRWMNLDPLAEEYFDNSPFNFVANTPLIAYDPDGKRIRIVGSDDYKRSVFAQLINLALDSDAGAAQVTQAINSDDTFTIFDPEYQSDNLDTQEGGGNDKTVGFDLSRANEDLPEGEGRNGKSLETNALTNLAHELSHFNNRKGDDNVIANENGYSTGVTASEVEAVRIENAVRRDLGLDERTDYGGVNVYGKKIQEKTYTLNGQKYRGYFLVRDKNYSNVARTKGINFENIRTRVTSLSQNWRGGKFIINRYKKPVAKSELNIEKRN